MLDDGRVLCLYDFDEETGTGTVGIFQNGTLTPLSQTANDLMEVVEVTTYGDHS